MSLMSIKPKPAEPWSPELLEAIKERVADGIGLGGDYFDPYVRAHDDRKALLRRLLELERPDAEAIAAAPELKDKKALVTYFQTDADRDEFIAALQLWFGPRARSVKVP